MCVCVCVAELTVRMLVDQLPLLTVSSLQMEWTWVPNMTAVKMRKRRPSKQRRMRRMTVAGGEK